MPQIDFLFPIRFEEHLWASAAAEAQGGVTWGHTAGRAEATTDLLHGLDTNDLCVGRWEVLLGNAG